MEQINKKQLKSDENDISFQIQILNSFHNTSNDDEIEENYVKNEVSKILGISEDHEKYQTNPYSTRKINKIQYNINLSNGTTNNLKTFDEIGFEYEDLYYQRKVFTESFLFIEVFESATSTETLDTLKIKLSLDVSDYIINNGNQILKPFNEIGSKIITYNPKKNSHYNNNGFFIYLTKKHFGTKDNPKYLYLKCSFVNVKNGISHELGSKSGVSTTNEISEIQFIKIKTYIDSGILCYSFSNEGVSNVTINNDEVTINLYEIISG